jgi:hypothetical protein
MCREAEDIHAVVRLARLDHSEKTPYLHTRMSSSANATRATRRDGFGNVKDEVETGESSRGEVRDATRRTCLEKTGSQSFRLPIE